MSPIVFRDSLATQVRLGPLRIVRWRKAPTGWQVFLGRWVLEAPAHFHGHTTLSERYGYLKARHILGCCLTRKNP
jgi:hypothetical protein